MTKEELLKLNYEGNLTNRELEDFFNSNVVMPRGATLQYLTEDCV